MSLCAVYVAPVECVGLALRVVLVVVLVALTKRRQPSLVLPITVALIMSTKTNVMRMDDRLLCDAWRGARMPEHHEDKHIAQRDRARQEEQQWPPVANNSIDGWILSNNSSHNEELLFPSAAYYVDADG